MARESSLSPPRLVSAPSVAEARGRAANRAAVDRARLALVLLIALCQGVLYLCLLPPWQHYDEPTHFEYAWLLANRPGLPSIGDEDQAMRRELAASMLEHHFYHDLPPPTLLTDQGKIDVGITELQHPPAYYMLVSLPLRLVRHLDLVSQLYVARSVSLALFLLTIAVAGWLTRELVPAGHSLRWALPLALALIPPFVDLMTAVNNDVGAVTIFTLFLWGAVRLIRRGPSWPRAAWALGAALLGAATKNTAAVALVLLPLAFLIAYWLRRGWRWRWLLAVAAALVCALSLAVLSWGDASGWYRGNDLTVQASGTRAETAAAPVGRRALLLEVPADGGQRSLLNPIVGMGGARLAGITVTIGAWMWSDQPGLVARVGLTDPARVDTKSDMMRPIAVPTAPRFVAWTLALPQRLDTLAFTVVARAPAGAPATRLYLDGAVLAVGTFPASQPPAFDDAAAEGVWGGARFANLVRNASAESGWPRLRPWFDRALVTYIHRSPAQSAAAIFDAQRLAPAAIPYMIRPALDSFTQVFAWSNVKLANPIWAYLSYCVALLALLGCLRWALRREPGEPASLRPALAFLGVVGLLVWTNTMLRPLPLLGDLYVIPSARYTFPAIFVSLLALIGGWRALWPGRLRQPMLLGLIAGLVWLNFAAAQTISSFYAALN